MIQEFSDNQTLFAEEEPLHLGKTRKKRTVIELKQTKKKPVVLFAGIGVVLLLVIAAGIYVFSRKTPTSVQVVEATPTPSPVQQSPTHIEELLIELHTAVENADPSKTALPFPPVAEQIRISQ